MQPTHNPQRGAARALLELLTEYPQLPALKWDIANDGVLRGHLHGDDVNSEAQAWANALGYEMAAPFGYRYNNADRAFQTIHLVWRDVQLSLSFYSNEFAHLAQMAVAA